MHRQSHRLPAPLQATIMEARAAMPSPEMARRAVGMLDLTSLGEADTEEDVLALCRRAVSPVGHVAAVCVWPRFVGITLKPLYGQSVGVASVVNFPHGTDSPSAVASLTRIALDAGADEIDVVFPYRAYLDGDVARASDVLDACRSACTHGATMKVILESGEFRDPDLLAAAADLSIEAGADFLKTSTGKTPVSATLEAAAVMLDAIARSGRPVGFKASGGLRDAAAAAPYLALADAIMGEGWAEPDTFRFGASALLDSLLATVGG